MPRLGIFRTRLVLFTASLLFLPALSAYPGCPHTEQRKLSTSSITTEFAVGFDLTPSYGTVAVAYLNGSTHSVAKIEGDAAYKEMMYRLSLDSSRTTHKPYDRVGDHMEDLPRHLWRQSRKNIGLPASNDVWTLSKMIAALRKEASTFVGEEVEAAAISRPYLAALYAEDTVDAFEYLSLENLEYACFGDFEPIHSVSSAYIAYNRSILDYDQPSNISRCRTEKEQPMPPPLAIEEPDFYTIAISYTYSDLIIGVARFSTSYSQTYGTMYSGIVDMELGFDARDKGEYGPGPYWEKLRYVLEESLEYYYGKVTKVIVWGDATVEWEFERHLREFLKEVVVCKHLEFLGFEDPVYISARGTAEFARRALVNQREVGNKPEQQDEL